MKDFKYLKTFEQFETDYEMINEGWSKKDLEKKAQEIQANSKKKQKLMQKVFQSAIGMNKIQGQTLKQAIANTPPEKCIEILNDLAAKAGEGELSNLKASMDAKTKQLVVHGEGSGRGRGDQDIYQ
jgi:hypothetical protein